MHTYRRPPIEPQAFRDASGEIVAYGRRWEGAPAEDAYSVVSHPERFAPLHDVADSLIAHLNAHYDVDLVEAIEVAEDLLASPDDVVRAIRVVPGDEECAALTFVFTGFPGIRLHAGLLHDFAYPVCGCDACDDDTVSEASRLEEQVTAVVTGHYRESIGGGREPWVESSSTYAEGSASGQSPAGEFPPARLASAEVRLRGRVTPWRAWPLRRP